MAEAAPKTGKGGGGKGGKGDGKGDRRNRGGKGGRGGGRGGGGGGGGQSQRDKDAETFGDLAGGSGRPGNGMPGTQPPATRAAALPPDPAILAGAGAGGPTAAQLPSALPRDPAILSASAPGLGSLGDPLAQERASLIAAIRQSDSDVAELTQRKALLEQAIAALPTLSPEQQAATQPRLLAMIQEHKAREEQVAPGRQPPVPNRTSTSPPHAAISHDH